MTDPMVSRLMGELAALRSEVAALKRAQPSGQGVSTAFGATSVRPTTTGFAAELTSGYDPATGYPWKALELNTAAAMPGFENPDVQDAGEYAFAANGDEGLTEGTRVWLERDPTTAGYVIVGSSEACCGWAADWFTVNNGTPPYLWSEATHGTSTTSPLSSNLKMWELFLWNKSGTVAPGPLTGIEATVPANEDHWVDAQVSLKFGVNVLAADGSGGNWDITGIGSDHWSQLLYVEARVVDFDGLPSVMTARSAWVPVMRGQVLYMGYANGTGGIAMVPLGDRVPTSGAGWDGTFHTFRGGEAAPQWAGTARVRFRHDGGAVVGRRFGWHVRVHRETVWPNGWMVHAAGPGATFFQTARICCDGETPQAPTAPAPDPGPKDDPPVKKRNRNAEYETQFGMSPVGGGPSTTPGGA